DGIREFARLRRASRLRCGQIERRIQRHIGRDIVENLVIAHSESATDYGLVVAKHGRGKPRGVRKTENGSEVVFVHIGTGVGERKGRLVKEERGGAALRGVNREHLVAAQQYGANT